MIDEKAALCCLCLLTWDGSIYCKATKSQQSCCARHICSSYVVKSGDTKETEWHARNNCPTYSYPEPERERVKPSLTDLHECINQTRKLNQITNVALSLLRIWPFLLMRPALLEMSISVLDTVKIFQKICFCHCCALCELAKHCRQVKFKPLKTSPITREFTLPLNFLLKVIYEMNVSDEESSDEELLLNVILNFMMSDVQANRKHTNCRNEISDKCINVKILHTFSHWTFSFKKSKYISEVW